MEAVKLQYTQEEIARQNIRDFVNGGLRDVKNNEVYDFDEVFDELESRYAGEEL